ncbi:MAG: ATP-binding protein [Candidatus Gracilibacteria bacterium]
MHYIPSISLTVPADLRCSALVRKAAKNAFDLAQIPYTWGFRLTLVIDELFMNAVKYGSHSAKNTVELHFYLKKDKVVIEMEDSGTQKKHKVSPKQLMAIMNENQMHNDLTKVSGRGLALIVKSWTDSFAITKSKQGGIKIKVEKYFANCILEPRSYKHLEFSVKDEKTIVCHLKEDLFQEKYAKEMQQIFEMIDNYKGYHVVFDMQKLLFLDFKNLGRITELYSRIVTEGGTVSLCNVSDHMKDLFAQTGFSKVFL